MCLFKLLTFVVLLLLLLLLCCSTFVPFLMRALSMLASFVREISLRAFEILSSLLAEHSHLFVVRSLFVMKNANAISRQRMIMKKVSILFLYLSTFSATLKQKIWLNFTLWGYRGFQKVCRFVRLGPKLKNIGFEIGSKEAQVQYNSTK